MTDDIYRLFIYDVSGKPKATNYSFVLVSANDYEIHDTLYHFIRRDVYVSDIDTASGSIFLDELKGGIEDYYKPFGVLRRIRERKNNDYAWKS